MTASAKPPMPEVDMDDLGDDEYVVPDHDEAPLRSGKRISPRVLIAAVCIFAIPSFVIARGVWSSSHEQTTITSALPSSVASASEMQGADYGDYDRARDRASAAAARQAGPMPTDPPDDGSPPPDGSAAGRQRLRGFPPKNTPKSGTPVAYNGPRGRMGDITDDGGDTSGSAPPHWEGNPNVLTPEQQRRAAELQSRLQAVADERKQYQDSLHASSTVAVHASESSSSITDVGRRVANTVGAPSMRSTGSMASTMPTPMAQQTTDPNSAAAAREILAVRVQAPSGQYVLAGWERVDVILDDGIRAAGAVNGRGGGGSAWGRVVKGIFDSTGTVMLAPPDSHVKLEYRAPVAGERELDAQFTRIVFPDMRWISLLDANGRGIPAGDPNGTDTMSARVDDHRNKAVRIAAATAGISAIPLAVAGQGANVFQNPTVLQSTAKNFGDSINQTADRYASAEMNVPPTLYVEPGRHVLMKFERDIPLQPFSSEVKAQ